MIAIIVRLVGWFGGVFTALWTSIIALPVYIASVNQFTEALARVIRATISVAIILALINTFVPSNLNTSTLWSTYAGQAGQVLQYVGYFVPLDLLFSLLDLYIFGIIVLLMFRLTTWLDAKAK